MKKTGITVRIFALLLLCLLLYLFRADRAGEVGAQEFAIPIMPEADLYFAGDSTIFGLGSSDPDTKSLPACFAAFMQLKKTGFRVQKLAQVNGDTQYFQRVFSALPDGAMVVYRGGFEPSGGSGSIFRRFFSAFLPGWFGTQKRYRSELSRLIKEKGLKVFYLDYANASPMQATVGFVSGMYRVPLLDKMKESGYFWQASIDRRLRFEGGGRGLNDSGYRLEALLLYNFFCDGGFWGLLPGDKLALAQLFDVTKDKKNRYRELKEGFRKMSLAEVEKKLVYPDFAIPEIMALVTLLQHEEGSGEVDYAQEEQMLAKLALLVFHEPSHVISGIMEQLTAYVNNPGRAPDLLRLKLHYAVLAARLGLVWDYRKKQYEQVFNSPFPFKNHQLSVLRLPVPYALEFCGRFRHETGFRAEDLSVREEWLYFFPQIPYEDLSQGRVADCNI
jgi:hypothetical protein